MDAQGPAASINEEAISLANSGKLKEALVLFKRAVSLNHKSPQYHNNLGVTQLRLGEFNAAEESFLMSLALDEDNIDAINNLKDLAKYSGKSEFAKYLNDKPSNKKNISQSQKNKNKKKNKKKQEKKKKVVRTSGYHNHAVSDNSDISSNDNDKNKNKNNINDKDDDDNEEEETETEIDEEDETAKPAPKEAKNYQTSTHSKEPPLKSKTPKERDPLRLTRKQKRVPDAIPRIHISELYTAKYTKYADGQAPFILTGAMDLWKLDTLWTPQQVAVQFPDAVVDFYPYNMDQADVSPYLVPLSTAVQEMLSPSGDFPYNPHVPGTYIQWNVNITDWERLVNEMMYIPYAFRRDEEWLQTCLPDPDVRNEYTKKVHWRMMLIGNKGAGMFNHQDVLRSSSWQAQVSGAKKWHICAPDQAPYLYGAGEVDCFYPNYEKYPLFEQARCQQDIVKKGEMIFYPKDYWHQTENMEFPSLTVSSTIVDEHNWKDLSAELKAECEYHKWKWQFSKELCRHLEKCYEFWASRMDTTRNRGTCTLNDKPHHDEL